VRNLVARELFGGVLTYHSYSQLILYPWGYTDGPIPDPSDQREMRDLADDMQRLIAGVHGETYTAQQSSRLYPTAGDTTDWTYGEYDVLPSFTVELRLAAAMVDSSCPVSRPGAAARHARQVRRRNDGHGSF
jgi:carboxypeptidase T